MRIRQALADAACALEAAGVPDPRIDAEWLLSHVTGMDRLVMRLSGETELTPQQEQRLTSLLLSRTRRRPLQYVLGTQGFYGLELRTDARALIPRQETETLCETGILYLRSLPPDPVPSALDLCSGSGAIALALKSECPFSQVAASDLSAEALSLARENARRLRLSVAFFAGDLFAAVGERRFDVILSNPPYIPTAECAHLQPEVRFEPRMALDGGADGLDFYRRIAREAPAHLSERGMLAVEVGDGQAGEVAALFEAAGLRGAQVIGDLYGHARVVRAFAAPCAAPADFQGGKRSHV